MSADESGFRAPRGTRDLLPPESEAWQTLTRLAMDEFALAGYAPVDTPMFEHTEVFERGVGEASEVVGKQMYTFEDRGGRSLTLRPEGTAPVVRAVLEHGLGRGALPVKLAYAAPMFRQERPQKGRFRQFFQVGIEAIGGEAPALDAEVIHVGTQFLARSGVDAHLLLNSIGHPDPSCRLGYVKVLSEFLLGRVEDLAPEDRDRVATNPLRTFDSKEERTLRVLEEAPLIAEHLCGECRAHFGEVRAALDDLGVAYDVDARLVRGLDYYTRTAFEFVAGSLGSQNAVGGGGRYDGLSESLGGPRLPGIGFAIGLDRVLISRGALDDLVPARSGLYVVAIAEGAQRVALKLAAEARAAGVRADLDYNGRSLKGQLKDAARVGARWAAIIGGEELEAGGVTLKDLDSGEQRRVPNDQLIKEITR